MGGVGGIYIYRLKIALLLVHSTKDGVGYVYTLVKRLCYCCD